MKNQLERWLFYVNSDVSEGLLHKHHLPGLHKIPGNNPVEIDAGADLVSMAVRSVPDDRNETSLQS